jgi:subtilisin family serine protease
LTTAPPNGLTWRLLDKRAEDILIPTDELEPPEPVRQDAGRGIRVCVVDSGVELDHPLVGRVESSWAVVKEEAGVRVERTGTGDLCGHGTACASIIRRVAPDCELHSVRVLGERFSGSGDVLLEGLRWAVAEGFDVINMSLSTTRSRFAGDLHALADDAYFRRSVIVASAHNSPVESFPWRFASVISVGSHAEESADLHLYNPNPPVEFFAPGQNVEVGWLGGKVTRSTGNSFATPYITGLCARILSATPRMTPFQLKSALYATAANVHEQNRCRSVR